MTDKRFFADSNIWLYAFMSFDPGKTEKSIDIISNTSAVLSTQVINELCVNLIKKRDIIRNTANHQKYLFALSSNNC